MNEAPVFTVQSVEPHPGADALDLIQYLGYQCISERGRWKAGDVACFIPDDTLVPVADERFSWLAPKAKGKEHYRVQPVRLRGLWSKGLIVTPPEGAVDGDDAFEALKLDRYNVDTLEVQRGPKGTAVPDGEEESPPDLYTGVVKYDLENIEKYPHLFQPGEMVEVSEKIDGSNARFMYYAGRFWVKSRNRWLREFPDRSVLTVEALVAKGISEDRATEIVAERAGEGKTNRFWQAMNNTPGLRDFLVGNPGLVVYGEVYGNVGRIHYGGPLRVAVYDVFDSEAIRWVSPIEWYKYAGLSELPRAPVLDVIPFTSHKDFVTLASGPSMLREHGYNSYREGVVFRPVHGRTADYGKHTSRLILKAVSHEYLTGKASKTEAKATAS